MNRNCAYCDEVVEIPQDDHVIVLAVEGANLGTKVDPSHAQAVFHAGECAEYASEDGWRP